MLNIPLNNPSLRRIHVTIASPGKPDRRKWWIVLQGVIHHITGSSTIVRGFMDNSGLPVFITSHGAGTGTGDYCLYSNPAGSQNNALGIPIIEHEGELTIAGGAGVYVDVEVLEVDTPE